MATPLLFDKSIQKLHILFKYSGMNLYKTIRTPADTFKYRWVYIINTFFIISSATAGVYYIIIGITEGRNFIEVTSVAPCLTFGTLAMIKSICHLMHENEVQVLVKLLQDLEIKQFNRRECLDKKQIIDEETKFLNNVINVLYVLNCLMIVVFDMTPFIMIAMKYYRTNEFQMLLPFLDVWEFLPYELKYWPFAYIHQIWTEVVALLEMGAADYLFFTCCTHIRVQFRLLQYDIQKIVPERDDGVEILSTNDIRAKFNELVQWHQDLINSFAMLEIIYSKSNLFNFLASSVVICLTGFNVTIVTDIVVLIIFVTFLAMGLMQIFFLCFFADMLTSASKEVSDAVYNCMWYLTTPAVVKQLLLVQTRSQIPCKLTAAGFVDVNLRAFMRVLSTSWSYFALLRTMYSG